jgi:AcrR family transcriptional regulator
VTSAVKPRHRAQRRPRADGERTRTAILRAAASLPTVDGLEGLSIGNLAAAIGMSKSGPYAHFRSMQELQLATVEAADLLQRYSHDRKAVSSHSRPPAGDPSVNALICR